jgi:hypothetical protein
MTMPEVSMEGKMVEQLNDLAERFNDKDVAIDPIAKEDIEEEKLRSMVMEFLRIFHEGVIFDDGSVLAYDPLLERWIDPELMEVEE